MTQYSLPRPTDTNTLYPWTERCLNERLDAGDHDRASVTAESWPEERARRRRLLADVLIPDWEKPDLAVTETGTIERNVDGHRWTIHKLRFQSLADYWITALLYVPEGAKTETPAVLLAQGHSLEAKAYPEYHSLSEELVRQGIVVLAYDPPGQGERVMNWDWHRNRFDAGWGTTEHDIMGMKALLCGWPLARAWVWDGMRALDVLLARPEVDPARVGMCGVSGGGTQTTWMLAADDRLTHASPACYITSWREQFRVRLGADPEQHPYPVQSWGWDQADILASFAPKPLMVAAVTNDFFPIEGTRSTVQKLEDLYQRIGTPGGVTLSETPDVGHGYHPPVREATVRWFCEQFGIAFTGGVPARDILPPADLAVTPTGQLFTSGFTRTLHTIIAEECSGSGVGEGFSEIERNAESWQAERRASLRELLRIPDTLPEVSARRAEGSGDGGAWLLSPEPGIELGVLVVRPDGKSCGVAIHAHELGADTDWRLPCGPVHNLVDAGWTVVSVDPRGVGASRDRTDNDDVWHSRFGSEQTAMWTWQMMDRPLFGQRVFDLLQTLRWTRSLDECADLPVAMVGTGSAAHLALFAAALDPGIERTLAIGPVSSFARIVKGRDTAWPVSTLPPHLLTWGDTPLVAALIAPRKLTIVAPVDEMRQPVAAESIDAVFEQTHRVYTAGYASEGLRIEHAGDRPESLRVEYRDWIR